MRLRLTERAAYELEEVGRYIEERNRSAAIRVRRAIVEAFELIRQFPDLGKTQKSAGVRRVVLRRYPYLIYYRSRPELDEVVILNVKHASRARLHTDA